jgi:hypothetical protein
MKSEDAYNKRKHKKWAKKVKNRENNTCEECGESYDVMTAHHNPPKDELPEDRKYDTDIGMCLCYPCHADQHTGTQRSVLLSWWEWYTSDE